MNLVTRILSTPMARQCALVVADERGVLAVHGHDAIVDRVLAEAGAISAASEPGSRVFLALPHGPDLAFSVLATMASGRIAVPLSPELTVEEVVTLARRFRPSMLIHRREGVEGLPDGCDGIDPDAWERAVEVARRRPLGAPVDVAADAPAWMVFTSGTTGHPRGVVHAHRSLDGRLPMDRGWTGLRAGDVIVHAGQLNWTYAFGLQILDALRLGATSVVYTGPRDVHAWGPLVARTGATHFAAVPSLLRRILKHDDRADRFRILRTTLCAGERLPEEHFERWRKTMGHAPREALGMSECSTFISSGPLAPPKSGFAGRPQVGRRIAVLNEESPDREAAPGERGILAVHRTDPGLMLGYADDPEATRRSLQGDWFVTGDLVRQETDGYVQHLGRLDDRMNAFGYRVDPQEVERAVLQHPHIAEALVTETSVRGGELSLIGVLIVPHEGRCVDPTSIKSRLDSSLAPWKHPRRFCVVSALPRSRNGKVLRREADRILQQSGQSLE